MAKVSIVIPVYNSSRYLDEAIESLINQTLQDIEIICVDDGSTDDSYEKLLEYKEKDKRIMVARHMEPSDGAAEARNIGMKMANSKWLAFMDADDFAEPTMLERAYEKAEELNPDILMFNAWYYDDDNKVDFATRYPLNDFFLPDKELFNPKDYKDKIFRMSHGTVWGRLFNKEFIDSYNLVFFSCHYWDDIEFYFVALCLAKKISVLNEYLMHYRWNAAENQSSKMTKHPEIAYKATLEIKRRFKYYGLYDEYRVQLLNLLLERAFSVLHRLDDVEAFTQLFEKLKNRYLKEIATDELQEDEYILPTTLYFVKLAESSESPLEYLIKKSLDGRNTYEMKIADLNKRTGGKASIVLYGAGIKGRSWFNTILNNPGFSVAGWVDQKFKKIGYPVQNPEEIGNMVFDFVIITIENKNIADSVKKYLINRGISENKIIWPY